VSAGPKRLPDDLVDRILDVHAEDTGYVERKLSLLGSGPNKQGVAPVDPHEEVIGGALAVANANAADDCYLVFGQDDHGNFAGEVAPDGGALSPQKAAGARKSLSTKLGRLSIVLSWSHVDRNGRKIWIAAFRGRPLGEFFADATGRVPVRSGGETVFASAAQQRQWLAEPGVYVDPATATVAQRRRNLEQGRYLDLRPIGLAVPRLPVGEPGVGLRGSASPRIHRDDRPLVDLVLNRGRVILTGLPGSGKTTAMAQLASVWAADETGPLPVTVKSTGILEALANQPLEHAVVAAALGGVPEGERIALQRVVERRLSDGTLALFIDGLDEVHSEAASVVSALEALVAKAHPDVEIVVATRDSAYAQARTLGFAEVRLGMPSDLKATLMAIAEELAGQRDIAEDERASWVRERLGWMEAARAHDPGFFETPLLSVLLLGASARHTTRSLPRSRSQVLQLLITDLAMNVEVPRRGRTAAVGTLQGSAAVEALLDGFTAVGAQLARAPERALADVHTELVPQMAEAYGLPSGLARAAVRDILLFWDEAGVFVASEAPPVIRCRLRLLAELAAAREQVANPSAAWVADSLAWDDRHETLLLAAGLSEQIADELIAGALRAGTVDLILLASRALSLGATASIVRREELTDGLVTLLEDPAHAAGAARPLTTHLVPPSRRDAVLEALTRALPEPEASFQRAAALLAWERSGAELDAALNAVISVEPERNRRRGIFGRGEVLAHVLVAAVNRFVPDDPAKADEIVAAARRLNVSLNGVIEVDGALRAVGQPRPVWASDMTALKNINLNVAQDWFGGAREWLEQIAVGEEPAAGGAARRLLNLRDLAATIGFAESAPRDLWQIVRDGLARDLTEVICVLGRLDYKETRQEARAFLARYPLRDGSDGLERLFDGADRGLTRWPDGPERQRLRDQLVRLLASSSLAVGIAAEGLLHDPDAGAVAAAVMAALETLSNLNRRVAAQVLVRRHPDPANVIQGWIAGQDVQLRITAALESPDLVIRGELPESALASLATDDDDSVRRRLAYVIEKNDQFSAVRSKVPSTSLPDPIRWTCLKCGSEHPMEDLKCSGCGQNASGVVVNLDVDRDELVRLERRPLGQDD
jgi:hypothetical protein